MPEKGRGLGSRQTHDVVSDLEIGQPSRQSAEKTTTSYEKFKLSPKVKHFLQPGITFAQLNSIATATSEKEVAGRLNEARTKLFQFIHYRSKRAA